MSEIENFAIIQYTVAECAFNGTSLYVTHRFLNFLRPLTNISESSESVLPATSMSLKEI